MSKKADEPAPVEALSEARDGDPREQSWGVLMADTTSGLGEASLHWYRTPTQLVRGVASAFAELTGGSPALAVRKVRARLGPPPWTARAMRRALADNESDSRIVWVGRYAELARGRAGWARALRGAFRDQHDAGSRTIRGAVIAQDEADEFTSWLFDLGAQRMWMFMV